MPKGKPGSHGVCSVAGCGGKHYSKGFCVTHYGQAKRNGGEPTTPKYARKQGRYRHLVARLAEPLGDACIEFPGTSRDERPSVRINGVTKRAYVWALELSGRPWHAPLGPNVLHSCDNGRCWNPQHLCWGTQVQNVAESIKRERKPTYRGTKLTEQEVREIRALSGVVSGRELGRRYNVSHQTISDILIQQTYRWVR